MQTATKDLSPPSSTRNIHAEPPNNIYTYICLPKTLTQSMDTGHYLYFTVLLLASGSLEPVPARRDGVLHCEEHPLLPYLVPDEPGQHQLLCYLQPGVRQSYLQGSENAGPIRFCCWKFKLWANNKYGVGHHRDPFPVKALVNFS